MKRTAFLLLTISLIAGCGKPDAVVDHAPKNDDSLQAPLTNSTSQKDFLKHVSDLTVKAKSFESNLNFGEAARHWKTIDAMLSQKYGVESWQTANARLSATTAELQLHYTAEQREQSKLVQLAQQKMNEALSKGDSQSAIRFATRSYEVTRTLFGENSPILGKQLLQIGTLHKQAGNVDEAISCFHRATETLNATFHTAHPDLERAHHELGQLYLQKKSYSPAISNLKVSTKLASRIWGDDSLMYARGANQLGTAYHSASQFETALKIHKATEIIRVAKLGEGDPLVAHSRLNKAGAYIELGDYSAAETDLGKAIQIFDDNDPMQSHLKKDAMARLATVYMLTNRPPLAEPVLADLLQRQTNSRGNNNLITADLQYRLGIAQARQGKYDLAEPLLRQSLTTQRQLAGPGDKSSVQTLKAIALLLKQTRRPDEAQQFQDEIRRVARESNSNEFIR